MCLTGGRAAGAAASGAARGAHGGDPGQRDGAAGFSAEQHSDDAGSVRGRQPAVDALQPQRRRRRLVEHHDGAVVGRGAGSAQAAQQVARRQAAGAEHADRFGRVGAFGRGRLYDSEYVGGVASGRRQTQD